MLEARRLAAELKAGPELFQATWGLYINAARNRRFDRAEVIGQELTAIADELGDPDLQYEALHHHWGLAYFTGDAPGTLRLTAEGIRRYDRVRHHRFAYVPLSTGCCRPVPKHRAVTLWGHRNFAPF